MSSRAQTSTEANSPRRSELESVVTTVAGKPITVRDVVTFFKGSGSFRTAVYELIGREVIRQQSEARRIGLGPGELDAYAEARRRELGLSDTLQMNNYCRWLGITFEQWLETIEIDLRRRKLVAAIVSEADARAYFDANRDRFKRVVLARLVCATLEAAADARRRIEVDGRDFCSVAREYSIDETTRIAGGYLGTVTKDLLPPVVDAAVFAATGPCLLGPFAEGDYWSLYQVLSISDLHPDPQTLARISNQLFGTWLEDQIMKARA